MKFAELFPARKINERVQTSVISNAAIRDIVLGLFSVSKSGKRDHKIVKSWKSEISQRRRILYQQLTWYCFILIESCNFRNVLIKYTDEFEFGLFSKSYLRTGQNLCVSLILHTVFSKTFVQIRSEDTGGKRMKRVLEEEISKT